MKYLQLNSHNSIASLFAAFMLICTVIMTLYEVTSRYIFNEPTNWVLDVGVFLFIIFSFLSLAHVWKIDGHISVDVLFLHFPPEVQKSWPIFNAILVFIFATMLFLFSVPWYMETITLNERSMGMLSLPMWPIKVFLPLGMILLIFESFKNIIRHWKLAFTTDRDHIDKMFLVYACFFLAAIIISLVIIIFNGVIGVLILIMVLLFSGINVFLALALSGISGLFIQMGGFHSLVNVPSVAFESLNNFALVCMPAFILVGVILEKAGVGKELFTFCSKMMGRIPGSEAVATVLACAIFAAISTSSAVTAATMGIMSIPTMLSRKYDPRFTYGVIGAGGTLGIMIPPSGPMIIYSAVTEESLGKCFLGGLIPGLLLAAMFMIYCIIYCWKTGKYERSPAVSIIEKMVATKEALWALATPAIILGGIYSGIFTPLESGAVAVGYTLIMVVCRRKMTIKQAVSASISAINTSTMIMAIVIGALILGYYITLMQIPNQFLAFVNSLNMGPTGVLVLIFIMYLVLGMFLEAVSCLLITLPIVYPLVISMGYDGIWFAVVVTLSMEYAMITPPVGLNLYVVKGITKAPISHIVKGIWPFYFIMAAFLVLIWVYPALSTWLPNQMISK